MSELSITLPTLEKMLDHQVPFTVTMQTYHKLTYWLEETRLNMNENELYILHLIVGLLIAYKVYSFIDDVRLGAIEIIFEGSEENE